MCNILRMRQKVGLVTGTPKTDSFPLVPVEFLAPGPEQSLLSHFANVFSETATESR